MSEKLNLKNVVETGKNVASFIGNRIIGGAYANNADKYGPAANITFFESGVPTPPVPVEGVGIPERPKRSRAA